MRAPQGILTVLASLVAGGCATGDVNEAQYDEVARIIAGGLTTPTGGGELGAFADTAMLARGELPVGFKRDVSGVVSGVRDGVLHRYFMVCTDAAGANVAGCGPTTVKALVLASWAGPLFTGLHDGVLRRGGYWTFTEPYAELAMVHGHTWMEFIDGGFEVEDYRDNLLVMNMPFRTVTSGGMSATITLLQGLEPEIHGDIALTSETATITLDGDHQTVVDINPIIIK